MQRILSGLAANGRIAYVVAQHMPKNGDNELLLRLLNRESRLRVIEAKAGDLLEPDLVYLIPSGSDGVVQGGRIHLLSPAPEHFSTPSVNALLASIAIDAGRRAIGIILSGAGSDGAGGCMAIKAHGGLTIAQNPQSAQHAGMSSAAIRAKVADELLEPEAIARRLNAMFATGATAKPQAAFSVFPSAPDRHLATLLQSVFQTTKIDFSSYKEETLLRRLNSRMTLLKIDSIAHYLAYTRQYPGELNTLQHLFLVSLSSFFRDSQAFVAVRKNLVELVEQKTSGQPIRIWVPGCASGEECYTFAILLAEILGDRFAKFNIRIIGSDLNPGALAIARDAVYRQTAFKETDPRILQRYFEHKGCHYKAVASIRAACEFIAQDVVSTKAPENLDMVSCRNLLIYMKGNLQDQLVRKFHQALLPGGLLFIGQSETIRPLGSTLFTTLDHYHRLYRRKGN